MWQGEEQFTRYFGLRGFKCLVIIMMNEINSLRIEAGLSLRTYDQLLTSMDNKMEETKSDDEGPEPE